MVPEISLADVPVARNPRSACQWTSWRKVERPTEAPCRKVWPDRRSVNGPACCLGRLPLGLAAHHFLHLALLGTAGVIAGLFGRLFLAGGPLGFLAFFFAQTLCICHSTFS